MELDEAKKPIGIACLLLTFILLSTSLPHAPKYFSGTIGAVIITLLGYQYGIKPKIQRRKEKKKHNHKPKHLYNLPLLQHLTEAGSLIMLALGIILLIYFGKNYMPLWFLGTFLALPTFILSRKWFLNIGETRDINPSESSKEYLKAYLLPIMFLTLFLASFLYSNNTLLLRIEGIVFITIMIFYRIWMNKPQKKRDKNEDEQKTKTKENNKTNQEKTQEKTR